MEDNECQNCAYSVVKEEERYCYRSGQRVRRDKPCLHYIELFETTHWKTIITELVNLTNERER